MTVDGNTAASSSDADGGTAESPPAEGGNGEQRETMIPRSRFDEVNIQLREVRAKLAEAEAKRLESEEDSSSGEEESAEYKKAQWLIEKVTKPLLTREIGKVRSEIESQLGMSLEEAKTVLEASKGASHHAQRQKYNELCREHGLDPANQDVEAVVSGQLSMGKKVSEAFTFASRLLPREVAASIETMGLGPSVSVKDVEVKNARHAAELAQRGIKARVRPIEEIIADRLKAGAKD